MIDGTEAKTQQGIGTVVYRVDVAIPVEPTRKRNMAVHQAAEKWPSVREAIRSVTGADVAIASINVVSAGRVVADDDEGAGEGSGDASGAE